MSTQFTMPASRVSNEPFPLIVGRGTKHTVPISQSQSANKRP
jgi:hypothetical protein